MNFEKSIEKGRIIYNESFWNKFWTLLMPVFITSLVLFNCFWIFEVIYDKPHKKHYWLLLLGTVSVFLFIVILIILYFKVDNLSKFEGKTRSNNIKLVREFAKKSLYEIKEKSNNIFIVTINSKLLGFNKRYLTLIFDRNKIYYNCTTFENLFTFKFSITNFKSPFYWFHNRKIERIFRIFLEQID